MLRFNSTTAVKTTVVGFGQGGGRIADVFASFKDATGTPYYESFALNSNRIDLLELKNIPKDNQVSLDLRGFAKDPSEAMDILNYNKESQQHITDLLQRVHSKESDLLLFCATMGGGTGTSTIVKSIEMYIQKHITPQIESALLNLLESYGLTIEEYTSFSEEQKNTLLLRSVETAYSLGKFTKIGIIAAIPYRGDGSSVLVNANRFMTSIWEMSKNPLNGIAFVMFPDNQMFYDDWIVNKDRTGFKNYRDYMNSQTAELFHELNMGTTAGGTDVTFDSKEFRDILLKGEGLLNLNRISCDSKKVSTSKDLMEFMLTAINGSLLHAPIKLKTVEKNNAGIDKVIQQKITHIGLFTIVNDDIKDIGSGYLDEVKTAITNDYSLDGHVFVGHLTMPKTNFQTIVFSFYKTFSLPERLVKGLAEEYKSFKEKENEIEYQNDSLQSFGDTSNRISNLSQIKSNSTISASLGSLGKEPTNKSTSAESTIVAPVSSSLGKNKNDDLSWLRGMK